MTKKLAKLFIITAMVFILVVVPTTATELSVGESVSVQNGDFESSFGNNWSNGASVAIVGEESNHYANIGTVNEDMIYVAYNLSKGASYELTFDYCSTVDNSIKAYCNNFVDTATGIPSEDVYNRNYGFPITAAHMVCRKTYTSGETPVWKTTSLTFPTHPDSNVVKICFRLLSADSGMGIDNIRFKRIEDNLMTNGGFEGEYNDTSTANIAHFLNSGGSEASPTASYRTEKEAHSGVYSCAIPAGKNLQRNFLPMYSSNNMYEVSFWMKYDTPAEGVRSWNFQLASEEQMFSPKIPSMYYTFSTSTYGKWFKKTIIISSKQKGTNNYKSAGFTFKNLTANGPTLYIDDICVRNLTTDAIYLIDNESFKNNNDSGGILSGRTYARGSFATEIENVAAGETVTAYLPATDTHSITKILIACVYEQDQTGKKKLVACNTTKGTAISEEFIPVKTNITVPATELPEGSSYVVSAFAWDSLETVLPVATKVTSDSM